jgi:hypothetical protein
MADRTRINNDERGWLERGALYIIDDAYNIDL